MPKRSSKRTAKKPKPSRKGPKRQRERDANETAFDVIQRVIEATEGTGKNTPPAPRAKKKVARDNVSQKRQAPSTPPATPGQIDRRGQRRIAKGQTPIDSTLDLHGLTQEQAYARLNRHIMSASNAGERCILVITGKGGGGDRGGKGEGVLRRNLPDWLGNQSLGGLVSAISPAARAHGGGGAFYVRLKKQK